MTELQLFVLVGTAALFLLASFVFSFYFIFLKRQTQNRLEKAALKAQYEQEILNASNEIQESTMHHISRELHDNVGQMLTLMKIKLNQLAEQEPKLAAISQVKEYTTQALADIKALSKSLNQENILAEGLGRAVAFELERVQRSTGITTIFTNNYDGALADKNEILVFRIFQECLQNTLKHAAAKNITVSMEVKDQRFHLTVIDNGIGFDPAEIQATAGFAAGAGLYNLQHRARLMGGQLQVQSTPGAGTQTLLMVPL